jgi:hypothetical protein
MTKLVWDAAGERFFETGVDRGVLYLSNFGYAWNGLISVSEESSGGEPQPYYVDGYKYVNVAASEEFAATIEAFSAPREFGVCDGTVEIYNGLSVTQQRRQPFGLSYRTRIGNDLDGSDHGYKIHLVYNALAAPSARNNQTIKDSPEPTTLSWSITTTPVKITAMKPTSHFVIDSRRSNPADLAALEDILYGTASTNPTFPSASELIALFA